MTKRKYIKMPKPFALRPEKNRAARFGLAEGDSVHGGEGADGRSDDPQFARQIAAAQSILRRYRKAFGVLAR